MYNIREYFIGELVSYMLIVCLENNEKYFSLNSNASIVAATVHNGSVSAMAYGFVWSVQASTEGSGFISGQHSLAVFATVLFCQLLSVP